MPKDEHPPLDYKYVVVNKKGKEVAGFETEEAANNYITGATTKGLKLRA